MKSLISIANAVAAAVLGAVGIGLFALLISAALKPPGTSQPIRLMGFELTPLGLLSVIVFCGIVVAFFALKGRHERRIEREVYETLQARRRQREES